VAGSCEQENVPSSVIEVEKFLSSETSGFSMELVSIHMPFNGYLMMIFIYKANEKRNALFWNVTIAVSKFTNVPPKLR
jgi:hypothetical protein